MILNDVHSRLNPTAVRRIARPRTTAELTELVLEARADGWRISVAGGRHAMGGQQFADGSLHLDMTAMDAVLGGDAERGLLHIQAGAMWPAIIEASHELGRGEGARWGIRQKQTGVDDVTLGGSISANAHGRGLLMQPIVDDIEDLTLLDAEGRLRFCNQDENAELFSLVIGGYGLFGIICSATLRLAPRQLLKRLVDIIDLDDAMNAVYRRTADGCLYGDFQFVIDPHDDGFLRRGVFSCYKPVDAPEKESGGEADLSPDAWLKLLKLAHDDKATAFRLYAAHYLQTDGNCYWSDTMQLSTYIPSYADFLEKTRSSENGPEPGESLVIGEHYVPPGRLLEFMEAARRVFRKSGTEVIYGTIRAIQRDRTSFLPWAGDDFVCIIFNLRTPHTTAGRARTADTFRALADAGNRLGGSFFLTYHRYATARQVEASHPRLREWLRMKMKHDPTELFTSDWYVHYRDEFAAS